MTDPVQQGAPSSSSSARDDELVRSLEEGDLLEHPTAYNNHQHEEKIDNHQNRTTTQQQQQQNLHPPKKNSTSEDEDEEAGEDSSQYLIPVLYHGGGGGGDSSFSSLGAAVARYALSSPPQSSHPQPTDDESNQYFMSEPSLSEDGDSTARIRAPHQASNDFLLDVMFSAEGSDDNNNNPSGVEVVHRSGTFQSMSSEEDEIMAHPSRREDAGANHHHHHHPLVARGSGRGLDTPSGGSGNELPQSSPPNHPQQRTPEQGRRRNRHSRTTPQLSPGNTSLSSWDSPAVNPKQVFLQFIMPENKYERQARMQAQQQQQLANQPMETDVQRPQQRIHLSQSNGSASAGRHGKHNRDSGSFRDRRSFSSEYNMHHEQQQQQQHPMNGETVRTNPPDKSIPTKTMESTDTFLHDLRIHSHGALEEHHYLDSMTSDLLTPMSRYGAEPTEVDAVMRRGQSGSAGGPLQHHHRRDVAFARAEDYDSVGGDLFSLPSAMVLRAGVARDSDPMNMTLSDSDTGEAGVDDSNVGAAADYDGQNSADDEKTVQRPPRIRVRPVPGHTRTRSGDGAAAQIATGGIDWKGMEQDRIPLPVEEADDDEEQPLVSGDRLQLYNWFAPAPGNESSSGTQGSVSFGSSNPQPNTGLPPIPGQNQKRPFWSSLGATGKEVSDSRQAWMNQAAQIQSSGSFNSHGSLHSLEETPEEYSEGGGSSEGTENDDDDDENDDDDANMPWAVTQNRVSVRTSIEDPSNLEQIFQEGLRSGGSGQALLPRSNSIFANIGKESASKASRAAFLPTSHHDDEPGYPTFICLRCNTRQREFFTVENASGKFGGPGAYLALYFFLYVICSLFIFGLEEGWMPLDCIYFAVITLTTTGLGDFVPTSDANKMICSMFIYIGVACIGLLLGSYIAGMMDERAIREQRENQMDSCPYCARIRALRESAERKAGIRSRSFAPGLDDDFGVAAKPKLNKFPSERFVSGADHAGRAALYSPVHHNHHHHQDDRGLASSNGSGQKSSKNRACAEAAPPPTPPAPPAYTAIYNDGNARGAVTSHRPESSPEISTMSGSPSLGSAVTRNILGRQTHTRHGSFDIGNNMSLLGGGTPTTYGAADVRVRTFSDDYRGVSTSTATNPLGETHSARKLRRIQSGASLGDDVSDYSDDGEEDEEGSFGEDSESSLYSSESGSSVGGLWDTTKNNIQVAKYIFLTLRLALFNSMVIIAVGCIGFWLIEGFTLIDGWYFTTVLLTTVGYGDIVPITKGGKLFATVYVLVAGTILLNNMSTISMIPLELRRRRIERAILTQFGDHLDDAALRELATGPVIQRLNLSANRADGLDECTREMFALAMLVRLGKVTERDIRETFAAFRHLDVNNDGVLNSKSIIAGMIARQRSRATLVAQSANNNNHAATPLAQSSTPHTAPGRRRSFSDS